MKTYIIKNDYDEKFRVTVGDGIICQLYPTEGDRYSTVSFVERDPSDKYEHTTIAAFSCVKSVVLEGTSVEALITTYATTTVSEPMSYEEKWVSLT